MYKPFGRILYGGDYNPNQWPREVWAQDMAYFKDAHINSATINVFSWAKIQPSENEYFFDELDEIVDMLSREGYDIVLDMAVAGAKVTAVLAEPSELEVCCRKTERSSYYFIINFKDKELPVPERFAGETDLLSGDTIQKGRRMKPYDALLVELPNV